MPSRTALWRLLALSLLASARAAWPASVETAAVGDSRAAPPILFVGPDFSVGLQRALGLPAQNPALSDFARELEKSARPGRGQVRAAKAQDALRLASLDALIAASLEADGARRAALMANVRAGIGGSAAIDAAKSLRAAIRREGKSDPSALETIQALHERLQKQKSIAALTEAFDRSKDAAFGDYVLVNSNGDPRILREILERENFPRHTEVFTSEYSLADKIWTSKLGRPAQRRLAARIAKNIDAIIKPYQELARKKNLKIWLGHPALKDGRLYTAYSLITAKGIVHTQFKKFLWKTERWLISEPERWQGRFKDKAFLLCSEVEAFFSINNFDRPTKIPEMRANPKPRLVVLPAYWTFNKDYYLEEARKIATPLWSKLYRWQRKGEPPVTIGVRPEGVPVFAVNYNQTQVVSSVYDPKHPRSKTKVHATLHKRRGWIQVIGGRVNVVALAKKRRGS